MNRFVRLVRENIIPSIVFVILVLACAGAWYYYHPSSPYHARYSFVVSYDAIGTLSPGNPVKVRGISAGEITKVELTEDAVYVTARVYATTRIPVNSEFRLINSGLMGEREMCVLTGDADELIHGGDTLKGHYDEGTSGVGLKLVAMLDDIGEIKDTLVAFVDSLMTGDLNKRTIRVIKKGKGVVSVAKSDVESWKADVSRLFKKLEGDLGSARNMLDGIEDKGGSLMDNTKVLLTRVEELMLKLNEMKGKAEFLLNKLAQDDNSAGLLLANEGEFNNSIEQLTIDIDALLSDIKKNGVKLNVDIF